METTKCNPIEAETGSGCEQTATSVPIEVTITGKINHTDYNSGQSAKISFNRFPVSVQEFKEVREQIGSEPHGAVALQVMAYEMYRHDKKAGEECIRLNNVLNNVLTPVGRLKELFGNDFSYARPYQIAALLKGATPENGYNPAKPYTVEVRVSKGNSYQYSNDYQSNVLYLEIITGGKDRGVDSISVLKTHKPNESSNGQYFIVFSCPGFYSQVKGISFTATFNGLDKQLYKQAETPEINPPEINPIEPKAELVCEQPTASNPIEVTITGKISHTDYNPGQSATISFNRFPATVQEFQEVRNKIGGEPHGAVALQVMAYEMYRRDKKTGEECIRMNNVLNNVLTPVGRLKELFGNDFSYARPYQIAALLKGAKPENGYNPTKPYTIEVRVSKGNSYQYSHDYQTNVLYLEVITGGKDRGVDGISVLKTHKPNEPSNGQFFIVFACSSIYSQVKGISFTVPFNGLD